VLVYAVHGVARRPYGLGHTGQIEQAAEGVGEPRRCAPAAYLVHGLAQYRAFLVHVRRQLG
jgi:hypothetical protein